MEPRQTFDPDPDIEDLVIDALNDLPPTFRERLGSVAVVAFGRAAILGVGFDIGAVVALTILAICLWSATVAAALPLLLRALRIDPAVVSAPLITTLVDGTGLIIYFQIARLMLHL